MNPIFRLWRMPGAGVIQCLRGLYAKHLGRRRRRGGGGKNRCTCSAINFSLLERRTSSFMNYLLHLERSADVYCLLAFVELLFHPIIRPKPVASGLGSRAAPAPVVATTGSTGANVVHGRGRVKSWQGNI